MPKRTGSFDYAALDPQLGKDMRKAASLVQSCQKSKIEAGRVLLAFKDRLEHGQFESWVRYECRLNVRTAQRFMKAAELVAKNDKLSYLPQDGLLALAQSQPTEVITAILSDIEKGEKPSAAEIRRRITAARPRDQNSLATAIAEAHKERVDGIKDQITALEPGQRRELLAWLDSYVRGDETREAALSVPLETTELLQGPDPEATHPEMADLHEAVEYL
jgi:hypothetical protein